MQWRSDAYLTFVTVWLRPKPRVHFTFDSPSDRRVELGVDFEDPLNVAEVESDEVRSETRDAVLPSIDAYTIDGIDSPEAYAIALSAGGRSFAVEHPEARYWVVSLQYVPRAEAVAWRVWFSNLEFEEVGFEVAVDPETGDVIETTEMP
jgi:hypothetical protein